MSKISLIIPVYCGGDSLTNCIESVLGQTHTDIELFLVSDKEIPHTFEQSHSVSSQTVVADTFSIGMVEALQRATGSYLFYLEEKDFIEPDCLEKMLASAEQYGSDMVLTHFKTYNENDGLFYFHESAIEDGAIGTADIHKLLGSSHRNRLYLEHVSGKLISKSWFVAQGISIYTNFLSLYDSVQVRLSYTSDLLYLYREEKQELVSVIVPVYNVVDYLPQCLESILHQTYSNLEILLINDGSTDQSGEICETYAQRDKRIRVIHQENGGLSHARNTGLDHMSGRYVLFVDSDDYLYHESVERLYSTLTRYRADIAMGKYIGFDDERKAYLFYNFHNDGNRYEFLTEDDCFQRFYTYHLGLYVNAWAKLYDSQLFNATSAAHSIRYPKGRIYEDQFTTHKLFFRSNRTVFTNEDVYVYRVRENSITTTTFSEKHARDNLVALEEKIIDFFLLDKDLTQLRAYYLSNLKQYKEQLLALGKEESDLYASIEKRLALYSRWK